MKKIANLVIFLLSAHISASVLMPADSEMCMNYKNPDVACGDSAAFYYTSEGECGCLNNEDVKSIYSCRRIVYPCDIENGYRFYNLFTYNATEGYSDYVGCGCFQSGSIFN